MDYSIHDAIEAGFNHVVFIIRGICKMDENGNLTEVVETKNIVKTADGAEADGKVIDVDSLVSMNMWGLSYGAPKSQSIRGSTPWSGWKTIYPPREKGCVYSTYEVQMVQNLEGMGFTVVPMGQGFASMSPPTKELMKLTLEKKLAHGGHPVLRWKNVGV